MAGEPEKTAELDTAEKGKATDSAQTVAPPAAEDADDPDFDDLDDVLDQFSANAPSSSSQAQQQTQHSKDVPSASGPGRPSTDAPPVPEGPHPGESEEDFIKRLTAELSTAMTSMSSDVPEDVSKASPEELARMGKELEEFTLAMEKEGIQPEDLLKAILGEQEGSKLVKAAHEDAERSSSSQPTSPAASKSRTVSPETTTKSPQSTSPSTTSKTIPKPAADASFEDTIRRTMERMESSSAAATSASQTAKSEEDMLAELLKSLGSGAGGDGDANPDELSNMFLSMMQQLTNKDMLYEPMKDLHTKFPRWLADNEPKLSAQDKGRYQEQQRIVSEIVGKFEERGYSDDDAACREFVWERMQKMQEQGAPPEELVANPLPGMGGGAGLPGMGDEGCPTQ